MRFLLWATVFIVGFAAAVLLTRRRSEPERTPLRVADALSSDTSGYARASAPRPFRFPEDHGPHPDFRTEWWYYTGNLEGPGGRRFAYQLTIFRNALAPPRPGDVRAVSFDSAATWSTRQVYMGHFALTDAEAGEHVAFERFSRGAAGLAGAQSEPFHVWLEDWQIHGLPGADSVAITARSADYGLDLVLARAKPILLQGEEGLDVKGPEPGNASYYFSMTRLRTAGTIIANGASYPVTGWSWLDREWSTSALSEDLVGWDWFSLQLGEDVELMYYRLRRHDGTTSPYSSGAISDANGEARILSAGDARVKVADTWTSRATGISYPSGWTLEVPSAETVLDLEPLVADQELDVTVRYWEGAVRVSGTYQGREVDGWGFVEMTGYGDEMPR